MDEIQYPLGVVDKDLYKEARKIADETYKRHSAWKSMFIVREYKRLGGEYKLTSKQKKDPPIDRSKLWRKEEWIQILPYLEKEKVKVICGKGDLPNACRPLRRVKGGENNITIKEIIKKWGKAKVKELTEAKVADMDGRLNWKTGTFTPSKKKTKK
tara:strand:+ start:146 stop:613 length:468 start_codon:yes stop_codon:yes gene_type:complete